MGLAPVAELTRSGQARIIDGTAIAAQLRQGVGQDAAAFAMERRRKPGLATILVGEDPASEIYVSMKIKACEELRIASFNHRLPMTASREPRGAAHTHRQAQRRQPRKRHPRPAAASRRPRPS